MSSFTRYTSFIYSFSCVLLLLSSVLTVPVPRDDPFDKFIEFLWSNNCSMPKEVELPFSPIDTVPFGYLYSPLKECQSAEALKENNEAFLLCREVFEVLQNITCNEYKLDTPKIDSGMLSNDVCKDFAAIQEILPKQNEYLSRKFGDDIICRVLCTGKYELLCKTLLWSYNTQAELKNLRSKEIIASDVDLENHPSMNEIPDEQISQSEKKESALNTSSENNMELVPTKPQNSATDKVKIESNPSTAGNTNGKQVEPTNISQKNNKSIQSNIIILQPVTLEATPKNITDESLPKPNHNLTSKNNDLEESSIEKQSKSQQITNNVDTIPININITTSDDKNIKNTDLNISVQEEESNKNTTDSKINTKLGENSLESQNEALNDVNNFEVQENETKEKETDLPSKVENPNESAVSSVETVEIDSKLTEPTVVPIFPDKSEDLEQQPELKDPEQYDDTENEADYPKPEYGNGFGPSLKKDSDFKNSLKDSSSQFSSSSNKQISPENFLGHDSDVNRNYLPARNYLPDQEDSHFFFYFLTIVLVLMAGYLIFHNKQKIIALIVEGRHERRRRSHGAGYKKLETK